MQNHAPLKIGLIALATALLLSSKGYGVTVAAVNYNRDVRPIFSDNCFACHGPDEAKRKAKLRLDVRDDAVKAAESGATALIPGKPDQSEVIKRLTSKDPDEQMPPAKSHKTVTPEQIETIRRWITEGANYQGHWAFTPPVRPPLPAVQDEKWVRSPIDRFVLAKLEKEGLKPSPEADKVTLLRRLYLDLIGLPPKPAEVDAFLKDDSPEAYEKVVDQLLASPHYGERWGRHWLDAARYADSDGYEKDKPRSIYFYRNWVIEAFNRDLPYNQFITEQLAGDLLPHPTQDQIVATGFLRNSMVNEEGGVDPEQFRMDAMFDRMEAIGKGMLGLTIQCAQCHSHKFDPISQEEYYRLFAFLNNDHEGMRLVYTPEQQTKIADLSSQMRAIESQLREKTPDWPKKMAAWEKTVAGNQPQWTAIPLENTGENDQRYIPQPDGSYLAQGYAPTKFTVTFKSIAVVDAPQISALRLELLTDPNLPCGGPGRSFKGTCALTDIRVEYASVDEPNKRKPAKIVDATADFEETGEHELEPNFYDKSKDRRVTGPVKFAIDGNGKTAWGIDAGPGRRNTERKAVFNLEKPIDVPAGKSIVLYVALQQNHGGWNSDDVMNNNLGRFRVSVTGAKDAAADPLPKRVRDLLAVPADRRSERDAGEIFTYWQTTIADWKEENDKVEALWKQWPLGVTTLTLLARDQPRKTSLLARGDWLKPDHAVTPGVPAILNPLPKDADGSRLTLARWMTSDQAPTTARVYVNRIWQNYFGLGLVPSSEDLGSQSEPPSHPELLDWLAVEFMRPGSAGVPASISSAAGSDAVPARNPGSAGVPAGNSSASDSASVPSRISENRPATAALPWSIKHIQRLIVTSAAYRQSSRLSGDLAMRDPYNRLLARASRFRVDGEIVRDIALSASGLLNEEMGGRSVMPPAPAFVFQPPSSYAPFPWIDEKDDEKYRRAVYTLRRRSTPYPVLQAFDVPNGDVSCVRRLRSNSPLQALASLNESIFVECAAALAKKAVSEGGATDEARIAYAFRRAVAREPDAAEKAALLGLLTKQRARFENGELKAEALLAGGGIDAKKLPPGASANELAAYTVVARVILNLDETITRE